MFEVVIVEDNKIFNKEINKVVDEFIFKNNYKAKKYVFFDYCEELLELIKNNSIFRIYILDMQLPTSDGVAIANYIRASDYNSFIIIVTAYTNKFQQKLLETKIMFLKFINKSDDYKTLLLDALQVLNLKSKNILIINNKDMVYKFETKDILYIYFNDRKSHIVLEYNTIETYKTLNELLEQLDARFMRSHKSCIVNIDRIFSINKKKKKITFDNNHELDLVSSKYLRVLLVILNLKMDN